MAERAHHVAWLRQYADVLRDPALLTDAKRNEIRALCQQIQNQNPESVLAEEALQKISRNIAHDAADALKVANDAIGAPPAQLRPATPETPEMEVIQKAIQGSYMNAITISEMVRTNCDKQWKSAEGVAKFNALLATNDSTAKKRIENSHPLAKLFGQAALELRKIYAPHATGPYTVQEEIRIMHQCIPPLESLKKVLTDHEKVQFLSGLVVLINEFCNLHADTVSRLLHSLMLEALDGEFLPLEKREALRVKAGFSVLKIVIPHLSKSIDSAKAAHDFSKSWGTAHIKQLERMERNSHPILQRVYDASQDELLEKAQTLPPLFLCMETQASPEISCVKIVRSPLKPNIVKGGLTFSYAFKPSTLHPHLDEDRWLSCHTMELLQEQRALPSVVRTPLGQERERTWSNIALREYVATHTELGITCPELRNMPSSMKEFLFIRLADGTLMLCHFPEQSPDFVFPGHWKNADPALIASLKINQNPRLTSNPKTDFYILPTLEEVERELFQSKKVDGRFNDITEDEANEPMEETGTTTGSEGHAETEERKERPRLETLCKVLLMQHIHAEFAWDEGGKMQQGDSWHFASVEPGHYVIVTTDRGVRFIISNDYSKGTVVLKNTETPVESFVGNVTTKDLVEMHGGSTIAFNTPAQFEKALLAVIPRPGETPKRVYPIGTNGKFPIPLDSGNVETLRPDIEHVARLAGKKPWQLVSGDFAKLVRSGDHEWLYGGVACGETQIQRLAREFGLDAVVAAHHMRARNEEMEKPWGTLCSELRTAFGRDILKLVLFELYPEYRGKYKEQEE